MQLQEIQSQELSKFFMSDPSLCYLGLPDEDLVNMYYEGEYVLPEWSNVLSIKEDDGTLVGVIKYEFFTTHAINLHLYVSSKYHKTPLVKKITDFLYNHFLKNTSLKKLLLMVPSTCIHIHKVAKRLNFELEGHIKNCYKWREKDVGVLIYGLALNREKN